MKNLILILVFLFSAQAVFSMGGKSSKKPSKPATPTVEGIKSKTFPELTVEKTGLIKGGKAGIYVVDIVNHNSKEKAHLQRALNKVREVMASKCFEEKLLQRVEPNKDRMRQTNGLTNAEVIKDLRSKAVEVRFEMYSKWYSKVKGYTYPSTNKIWTNRKFHNGSTDCNKGSNALHEISHKMGYGHAFKANNLRPYTVPYSLNWVMSQCCK